MFLLSYVNIAICALLSLPFFYRKYRVNDYNAIRSLSAMLCEIRPYGHLLMNVANLCLFLIISIEFPLIAWLFWISLQLIITFDIDRAPYFHLTSLIFYIAMLITFWIYIVLKYDWLYYTIQIWVFTGVFCLVWFYNMWTGKRWEQSGVAQFYWNYSSMQSVIELIWILCISITFFLYEKMIREKYDMKSSSISI
jgi:hypothetical protein